MSTYAALTRPSSLSGNLFLIASGAIAITLAAKAQIPFWPVPMTLHTLAVMLLAIALGPVRATAAMMAYLVAGAAGWPVFSGSPERGIGLAYMAGPTGGYLLGYLIAAGLTGWLAQGRTLLGQVLAMLAGLTAVYICGLAWLALSVPSSQILSIGLTPFLSGDLLKIMIAAMIVAGHQKLKGRM